MALSIYAMGSPVGIFLGFLIGAWLAQTYGWRIALFSFGIPGLILAAVIYRYLKEPLRGAADGVTERVHTPGLATTMRTLISRPTYVHNCIGSGLYTMVYVGLMTWTPSFFARNHDMSIAEIGTSLAFVAGGAQLVGVLAGGWLADRLAAQTLRWLMRLCAIAVALAIPFYVGAFLSSSAGLSLVLLVIPFICSSLQAGPQHATTQGVAPIAMRATAAAIYLLIVNLLAGLGPLLIGVASDYLQTDFGSMAIGWSIVAVASVFSVWSALHFFLASRTIVADMARSAV
jgi:predicted MFS family arabinose efflux permease